jgi:hypothetical protein
MKLAKVSANEPSERFAVSMKVSAHNSLKAYQEFYKATYGEEISLNQLIENMLVDYMKDDKDFQKAIVKSGVPSAKPAAPAGGKGN